MPTRICSFCGKMITWKSSTWKYEYKEPPFFCSAPCCMDWLLKEEGGEYPIDLDGCSRNTRVASATTNIYSPKFETYFRSTYELLVAEVFYQFGIPFEYEEWLFQVGKVYYLPDFLIKTEFGYFIIEVKGVFEPGSKKKIRTYHSLYGDILPLVLFPWNLFSGFRKIVNEIEITQKS